MWAAEESLQADSFVYTGKNSQIIAECSVESQEWSMPNQDWPNHKIPKTTLLNAGKKYIVTLDVAEPEMQVRENYEDDLDDRPALKKFKFVSSSFCLNSLKFWPTNDISLDEFLR